MAKIKEKDIAVIGLSFKLPGGDDPESFWETLLSGRDCIRKAPPGRWNANVPPAEEIGDIPAGFLENIDLFDAAYFNIPPQEAAAMDPRQRLFLETAVTAADSAGYGGEKLWGTNTGVFVGASGGHYTQPAAGVESPLENGMHHAEAMIANRVSHFMNLHGPSKTIDTLCSSTLVAVHEACRNLRTGECQMAVAGGINVILSSHHVALLAKMNLLSPSGRCKTFDETADGFVLGEGVGAFLLKPLTAALADGDPIWGVIKGAALNHNGRTDNIMMPDAATVSRLVEAAWRDADINPATVAFIETNGTGTPLGDAVEIQGLKQAFGKHTSKRNYCGLGAVKTCIGNLESASGVGALIKVLLSMKHGVIPPNLHFTKINPLMKVDDSPFYLCNTETKWPPDHFPRRAGINACGIGGTNCHIIIEEPPGKKPNRKKPQKSVPQLLCLSGRTPAALKALCGGYLNRIESQPDINISDLCATHNTGRTHFHYGLAVVARNRTELMAALKEISDRPENQWSGLKNVFFSTAALSKKSGEKSGVLSTLLKQYRSSGITRKFWCQRSGRVVFLIADAETVPTANTRFREANALKKKGIVPDGVLGLGKGVRVAQALLKDTGNKKCAENHSENPEKHADPDSFFDAVKTVSSEGYHVFIGIGLSPSAIESAAASMKDGYLTKWPMDGGDDAELVQLAANLYAHGISVDFQSFYAETFFQKIPLPPYPFERKSYHIRHGTDSSIPSLNRFDFLDSILNGIHPELPGIDIENRMTGVFSQTLIRILGYPPSEIDADRDFRNYGINSIVTTQVISILESRLGIQIGPSIFSRYTTIKTLAAFLKECYTGFRPPKSTVFSSKEAVFLTEAGRKHLKSVSKWLNDTAITQWLDPFFQAGFSAKTYGFFLSKRDKKTFIITYRSRPVGICGLVDLDLQNRTAETWLVIGEASARARGVAVAAGAALCEKAFYDLELQTLTGKIRIDNEPALSMMHYTGWQKVGVLKNSLRIGDRFYDRYLFQLIREDFEAWRTNRTAL